MVYTYKGKNYPKNINPNHPEIEEILSKDFDLMTRRDYYTIMELVDEGFSSDLNNLVLREIGRQWGKTESELENDKTINLNIVSNALMYSVYPGVKGVSYETLLEVLRQSDDFINMNLPYVDGPYYPYAISLLWVYGCYNPEPLKDFLLEPGISHRGKEIVANMVGRLANLLHDEKDVENYRQVIRDVTDAYIKDYPEGKICDKQVMSYIVYAATDAGLKDMETKIRYIYDNGMVDESYCGDWENTLFGLKDGAYMDEPIADSFQLFFSKIKNSFA